MNKRSYPQAEPTTLNPLVRLWLAFKWEIGTDMNTLIESNPAPFSRNPYSPHFQPIVKLPEGWLPCCICGDATSPGDQSGVEFVPSLGREVPPNAPMGAGGQEFETQMTRCSTCADRLHEAERLVEEFPRGRGRYVSPSLAIQVVERSLAALAAVNASTPITSERSLRLLIQHVGPLGVGVTWWGRFAPIAERTADSKTGSALPWAWLPEEQRIAARKAATTWMSARTERPRPLAPPIGHGCYLCGVATVEALPSRAAHVWREANLRPEQLGGTGSTYTRVSVCAPCYFEAQKIGSYGPTLLDRLILRAAGIDRKLGAETLQINGARAWGVTGEKPNESAFAHLALGTLRDDFESGRFAR